MHDGAATPLHRRGKRSHGLWIGDVELTGGDIEPLTGKLVGNRLEQLSIEIRQQQPAPAAQTAGTGHTHAAHSRYYNRILHENILVTLFATA
jgi:hypothetical protein